MPSVIVSPNMFLPIPVAGTEPGPQYALDLNASLTLIDQHDHSPGHGVLITPNGLNINLDLPINDNNLTLVRSVRFQSQSAPLALVTDLSCLYAVTEAGSNGDLWYNDASGNPIQITKTGAVLATISALISGTNEASFVANQLVVNSIQSNGTPANIVAGSLLLGNNVSGTKFLTLQPPNAMAANYSVTLPPPNGTGTTDILTYDTSNNILIGPSLASITAGSSPTGSITMYGGTSAPTNWLLCDGTSYLRTAQVALFAAIGTAYGAADGTHFNVPDMRGMFPRGTDPTGVNDPDFASRTANNAGGNTAGNVGSQQAQSVGPHNHNTTCVDGNPGAGPSGATWAAGALVITSSNLSPGTVTSTNGTQTNPINVYVTFIIKT